MGVDQEPPDDLRAEPLGSVGHTRLLDDHLRRFRWLGSALLVLVGSALVVAIVVSSSPRPSLPPTTSASATVTPGLFSTFTTQDAWSPLAARHLDFPAVASLAACPVTPGRQIDPSLGLAAGTGPLSIVLVQPDGEVAYEPAAQWGDSLGWGGMPLTLWLFPVTFSGPVLVRGRRLDASGQVAFNQPGGSLEAAAQFAVPPGAPVSDGSGYQAIGNYYMRFNAPGCYGLQVDWLGGAERIIFRAVLGA